MKHIPRFIPTLKISEIIQAIFINIKNRNKFDFLKLFSEKFGRYIGVRYAIPVPSARLGLVAILSALKIPRGREVIIPGFTHHIIPSIFRDFGLEPRFVDIDPNTYCIDTSKIERAINESTAVICPVHLYGRACNMNAIMEIAQTHKLLVIEDCAQSCGGVYSGKKLGSFGTASIFSFHPHKNVSVLGSGMVATNSLDIFRGVVRWVKQYKRMSWIGVVKRLLYTIVVSFVTLPGIWRNITVLILKIFLWKKVDIIDLMTSEVPEKENKKTKEAAWYMPQNYHGVIGLKQLENLDLLNKRRINNGNMLLRGLRNITGIGVPSEAPFGENIYTTFVVRVGKRDKFRRYMFKLGVDTHSGDISASSGIPGFQKKERCKNADNIVNHIVHLPVYPDLSNEDLVKIIKSVKKTTDNK